VTRLTSWLMSTDHKRIGIMYLAGLTLFLVVGTSLGVLMRLSAIAPGKVLTAHHYNQTFTLHGVLMIFLFIIPGIPVSFGNFLLPLLIGAATWPSRG